MLPALSCPLSGLPEGPAHDATPGLPVHLLQDRGDACQRPPQPTPQVVLQQREAQVPLGGAQHVDDPQVAQADSSLECDVQSLCYAQLALRRDRDRSVKTARQAAAIGPACTTWGPDSPGGNPSPGRVRPRRQWARPGPWSEAVRGDRKDKLWPRRPAPGGSAAREAGVRLPLHRPRFRASCPRGPGPRRLCHPETACPGLRHACPPRPPQTGPGPGLTPHTFPGASGSAHTAPGLGSRQAWDPQTQATGLQRRGVKASGADAWGPRRRRQRHRVATRATPSPRPRLPETRPSATAVTSLERVGASGSAHRQPSRDTSDRRVAVSVPHRAAEGMEHGALPSMQVAGRALPGQAGDTGRGRPGTRGGSEGSMSNSGQ